MTLMPLALGALLIMTTLVPACSSEVTLQDKLLTELSDDEFIEACEAYGAGLSEATLAGMARRLCMELECAGEDETAVQACVDDWTLPRCRVPDAGDEVRECEAAVDVLYACEAAYDAQQARFADVTCAEYVADVELTPREALPECADAIAQCPQLFE